MQKNSIIPNEFETDSFTDSARRERRRNGETEIEEDKEDGGEVRSGEKREGEGVVEIVRGGKKIERSWVERWVEVRGRSPGWTSHASRVAAPSLY